MKTRARLLSAATGALLVGCAPSALPEPTIVSVEPAQVEAHTSAELRIRYDALLPLTVDYSRETAPSAMNAMKVYIGEQLAPIQRFERPSTVIVSVPDDVPEGEHEVRLVLSDGREAKRPQHLVVGPSASAMFPGEDGGTKSDGGTSVPGRPGDLGADGGTEGDSDGGARELFGISGYQFDSIGEQVRDTPFVITLRAQGSAAATFDGTVSLSVSKGTITPTTAGPFKDGVVEVTVSVDHPSSLFITAEDAHGVTGSSNEFQVRPH